MATTVSLPVTSPAHVSPHLLTAKNTQPSIEEKLHHATQIKRIRVSEFFKDYDPLRSGYISCEQFRRCLDQHLGLKLSESDYVYLCEKYDNQKTGRVNYRAFAGALENAFDPSILDGKPEEQIANFQSSVQPTVNKLPSVTFDLTDNILKKCQEYNEYHGISVKSCYTDFDRHHRGFITESQFQRNFPGPTDVTPAEITTLAQRYYDPSNGLYNYLQFHYDIERLGRKEEGGVFCPTRAPTDKKASSVSLDEIFQRIRDAVYNNGIRTTEFFRDHDKLRSGVITENQFICGLSICCGSALHLTREEIQRVVNYYKNPDGRVRYKEFCDLMENAYNVPDLEKKPTTDVYRPLRGHLIRPLNTLESSNDEERVRLVLERLRNEVKTRRLMLYPYFRDFDRGKGYTRGVTKPQFERLLHFLSLEVNPEEIKLLVHKFEAANGTDVNYVAFVQTIDEEYTGQVKQQSKDGGLVESSNQNEALSSSTQQDMPAVDIAELVARIREHVVTNRIRVSEHFEDFDPLRSGFISNSRFRQGLSSLGLPYLTDSQFMSLCAHYGDPKQTDGRVWWKKFLTDVDPVITSSPPLLRDGAVDFSSTTTPTQKDLLDTVMFRLREKASQRRVMAKPCFQDFDRHHMGYVTPSQFRQCLSYLGLQASSQELSVIELRFSDSKGLNYLQFLEELLPSDKLENKYKTRISQLVARKERVASGQDDVVSVSLQEVLGKIKTQVSKKRVRVLEFIKDYDKLRSGRIPMTSFRRALDICGFELTQQEVATLEERYQSSKDPSYVDYMAFSDEIESIFTTKNLEKTPTAQVQQFKVPVEVDLNVLSPEEEQILQKTLHRLAERVRVRRIQLMPLFEDYDKVHIGSVTRSQFHRVLSELELGGLVNALEYGMLYRKFDVKVGGWSDVNYIAFCGMCDTYAQTKWSDPSLK